MDNRPIGVFDSGLGGLTAVKELKKVTRGYTLFWRYRQSALWHKKP